MVEKSKESFLDTMNKDLAKNDHIINNLSLIAPKKVIIKKLNKLLNIKHSQDTKTIISKDIMTDKVYKYMKKNIKEITTIFDSGVELAKDTKKDNSSLFKLLNSIYFNWSGSNINIVTRNKTYKLNGLDFYNNMMTTAKDKKIKINYCCDDNEE